jgi:hypothetical protein
MRNGLREHGAVYQAVADTLTAEPDRHVRRLSNAANYSRLWLGMAAAVAVLGRTGGAAPGFRAGRGFWRVSTASRRLPAPSLRYIDRRCVLTVFVTWSIGRGEAGRRSAGRSCCGRLPVALGSGSGCGWPLSNIRLARTAGEFIDALTVAGMGLRERLEDAVRRRIS